MFIYKNVWKWFVGLFQVHLQVLTACNKDFPPKNLRMLHLQFFLLSQAFFILEIQISTLKFLEPLQETASLPKAEQIISLASAVLFFN